MEKCDKFSQVASQKIKGHFNRQKLMLFVRLARRGQDFVAPSIKTNGQRCECRFSLVERDPAVPFAIQTDFDTVGVKTVTPIEFLANRELVLFET